MAEEILQEINSPGVRDRVSGAIPLYNQAERMMTIVAGTEDWKIIDSGTEPVVDHFGSENEFDPGLVPGHFP